MEYAGYLPPDEFWAMDDRMDQEIRTGALQRQNAAFSALTSRRITITVDGAAIDFTLWRGTNSWLAAGMTGTFGIVIDAQRNPPQPQAVSLTRVTDVEPLLHARRAALKALRGEA